MSQVSDPESRLSEVLRLATLLSEQVLDAQIMKRPVSEDHLRSLLEAALLLEEHQYPLPPMLGQIMDEIAAVRSQDAPLEADAEEGVEQNGAKGIARLLRPFRGRR